MDATIAAVLVFGGPIMLAVFAIGVMALTALVTFDVITSRRHEREAARVQVPTREAAMTRISIERGIARAFVIAGGVFWGVSSLAAAIWYERGLESMFFVALAPFLLNMASLVMGWRWERTASVTLALTSAVAVAWGFASNFEPGVWGLFILLLIGPMMTASVLFWMARRGEVALELRFAQPELAVATVERPNA
jgi:hypothetical protein